jgi:hypothetical protein
VKSHVAKVLGKSRSSFSTEVSAIWSKVAKDQLIVFSEDMRESFKSDPVTNVDISIDVGLNKVPNAEIKIIPGSRLRAAGTPSGLDSGEGQQVLVFSVHPNDLPNGFENLDFCSRKILGNGVDVITPEIEDDDGRFSESRKNIFRILSQER